MEGREGHGPRGALHRRRDGTLERPPSRGELRLRGLAFATADSVGYVIGAYRWDADTTDTGKFVLALRRARGGRWLIAADIDNSNSRPGPPPGGTGPAPAP